jgi:acyl-CoA thioesterase
VQHVLEVARHAQAAGRGRRLQTRPHPAAAPAHEEPGARAKRLAAADPYLRWLGVTCIEAAAGTATVTIRLAPHHINFNGTCHGGVTFALADTAFGLAANSYGRVAAGIDAHMTYQQAAYVGDTLTARSVEVSRSKKLAVYRVDVTRGDGAAISSFTGTVYVTQVPTP